jgi:ABC transporter substrate binding protein
VAARGAGAAGRADAAHRLLARKNDPEAQARIKVFRHGLEALGWTEGRNIQVDYRVARGDAALAQAHADELVSLASELIVGLSTLVTAALKQATRTIPIIFARQIRGKDDCKDNLVASRRLAPTTVTAVCN